tara:strand:+ start:81 stop:551 length:471 start_codon:yes stop_codon:yes gene_type:complete
MKKYFFKFVIMKKPLIILFAILIYGSSYSQTIKNTSETIGKISTLYKYIELSKQVIDDENIYNLKYQNLEFPQMTDLAIVEFKATDEEFDDLYNKILLGSKMKKNDPINYMDLGKGRIGISRLASGQVKILYNTKGSTLSKWTWLSKAQLRKIFGK